VQADGPVLVVPAPKADKGAPPEGVPEVEKAAEGAVEGGVEGDGEGKGEAKGSPALRRTRGKPGGTKVQGQKFPYRGPKMPVFTQPKTTLYLTEKNCAFHRRLRIVRIIIYKNLDNFYFILVAHEIVLCTS